MYVYVYACIHICVWSLTSTTTTTTATILDKDPLALVASIYAAQDPRGGRYGGPGYQLSFLHLHELQVCLFGLFGCLGVCGWLGVGGWMVV